jgi:hypothetical protein
MSSSKGHGPTDFIFNEEIKNLLNDDEYDPNIEGSDKYQTTLEEERENIPYGDSPDEKNPEHDRWYLQNVNGINTELNWIEWRTQMKALKELQVDGFSFTETNLKWTPEQTKAARNLGKYWFKQFSLQTSSSNDPTTRKAYQPGGTCTGITNNLAGRITKQGSDPSGMGRWSYFCLEGQTLPENMTQEATKRKIYVVTAYCVAQPDSASPGHETAFMQQKRMLTLRGEENPKPRKQVFTDLTEQIKEWQKDNAEIVLCLDANADLLDKEFQDLIRKTELIDLMATRLGADLPETYVRGKKTIDHIFGSPRVEGAIECAGYFAFNDGIMSDHRGIFIDFNRAILFGKDQVTAERPQRMLSTKNKKGAAQYRTTASQSILSNNILKRAQDIEAQAKIGFTTKVQEDLEVLDTELHNLLLKAEQQIDVHSHLPWSPTLHKAYQVWKYWKVRLSYLKTKRIPGERVNKFLKKWQQEYEVFQGDENRSISSQLRRARKALYNCRQNSGNLRTEYMERIAIEHEIEDNPKRAKIVKRIMRAEEQAKMYRKLRGYLKPQAAPLTYVEIPTDPSQDPKTAKDWKKVFNKDELERILHERNRQHFAQAATDKTPFTVDPLYGLLGFTADTDFSEQFRTGTLDLQALDLDDDVYALLEELLPKQDDPAKISEDLPLAEVISGFRKWNENTMTGGRHLGHYKTWLMKRPKEEVSLSEEEFFQILITIYRTCIQNQYPLKRWKTCLNLFIPKDSGSSKLHRLRVIHIVDTCLNFLRRFFIARRLLHHIHDHHKLAEEQWGGIPGRTAIDLVMSKEMMTICLHLMRKNGAITDVDATACYDRMVPALIWLGYFKAGATWNIVQLFALALLNLKYFIVTAFGISLLANQHSDLSQFLGPGQGATDAPFAWALISTYLICAYKKQAHGCTLKDPTGKITWKRAINMFVDDSYLFHALLRFLGAIALMALIAHDISKWSKLLWTSGGAINFTKSFYTMVIWTFTADGIAKITLNDDLPANTVSINNPSKPTERQPIKRKCVTTASKTLGVFKAADLSQTGEFKHLKQKAEKFTKALVSCPLSHMHAWLAYMTVFIPGVTYSSPTTSLTEEQCDKLEKIVKPALVKKLGLPDTFPNLMLYADKYFGGIGLLQLFAEQGMNQILLFMRHIRAHTDLGDQITIGLRYYQLQAGLSTCVLTDTRTLPYIDIPWFDTLRQYLANINGRVEITEAWRQTSQREQDTFLMENFLDSKAFTPKDLKILNACRMYLQVTRVSDIATTDGSRILARILSGDITKEQLNEFYQPNIEWPRQDRPNKAAWNLWRKALNKTICTSAGKLYTPLGQWNAEIDDSWKYYFSTVDNYLYVRQKDKWTKHRPTRLGIIQQFTRAGQKSAPPTLKYPAIPKIRANTYVCHHSISSRKPIKETISTPTPETFAEYIQQNAAPWEKHLLRDLEEPTDSELSLADNLKLGKELFLVSDGGDTDGSGYYGWVIANDTHILYKGSGLSPGNQELNESLRSESTGYLAILRFLLHYKAYHQLTLETSPMIHLCDNKSLVSRSPDAYRSAPPNSHDFLKPDYDVQMQIIATIKELDIDIHTKHVKGHQDDDKTYDQLSYEAQLNIQADRLATQAWQTYFCAHPHVHYPDSRCTLYINNAAVNRAYRSYMRRAYSSHDAREYLMDKYKWDVETCEGIDWYSHGTALKSLPHNQQRFVHRFIIDWLPINNRLHVRGRIPSNLCTLCDQDPETERHFLYCLKNKHTREKLHESLRKVFNKHNVDPNLRKLLYQGLDISIGDELKTEGEREELKDIPEEYRSLVEAIENVGIYQLWYGRFPIEWDWYQRRYLKQISEYDNEPTGEPKWLRAVILVIWQHCYQRWIERCDRQYENKQTGGFKHEQLLHQIHTLYAMKDKLLVQDQYIFQTPLEEWKDKTTTQLDEWLLKYKPVLKQCLSLAKKHSKQNAQDIRKFYTRTAEIPATIIQPRRRNFRAPVIRRPLKQKSLHNTIVREQLQQPRQYKPKTTKNGPSTNLTARQHKTKPMTSFFPPKDTRAEHRKLSARERSNTNQANTSAGESNNIPE